MRGPIQRLRGRIDVAAARRWNTHFGSSSLGLSIRAMLHSCVVLLALPGHPGESLIRPELCRNLVRRLPGARALIVAARRSQADAEAIARVGIVRSGKAQTDGAAGVARYVEVIAAAADRARIFLNRE